MFKFPPAVQAEPSYSSVAFVGPGPGFPPVANAAVCIPAPAAPDLPVAKFPPAVQVDPSYSSAAAGK